jgi:hypothetical protein
MAGALAIAFVLVIVLPVLILLSGMIAAVVIGSVLKVDGEANHPDSELIDLNT